MTGPQGFEKQLPSGAIVRMWDLGDGYGIELERPLGDRTGEEGTCHYRVEVGRILTTLSLSEDAIRALYHLLLTHQATLPSKGQP